MHTVAGPLSAALDRTKDPELKTRPMRTVRSISLLLLSFWCSSSFAEVIYQVHDCGKAPPNGRCAQACSPIDVVWTFDVDVRSNRVIVTSKTQTGSTKDALPKCIALSQNSFSCKERSSSPFVVFTSDWSMKGGLVLVRSKFQEKNLESNDWEQNDIHNWCAVEK